MYVPENAKLESVLVLG